MSCGEENTVDSLPSLMENITISSDSVGSTHWIEVTHVNTPNSFYVRPTAYNKYLSALQAPGNKVDANDVNLGNVVILKSKHNKSYVRGQILFIAGQQEDMKLELFAMDYGNIETLIPFTECFKPRNKMSNSVPSLVKHCQLELCKPVDGVWKDKSIDAMKFYIGRERTKIIIQDKSEDLLTVKMYNSCPEDISTMLALQGYSTLGYDKNSINRFDAGPAPKQAFYVFPELKVDDCIQVRTQSGSSLELFYVADINNYKKYIEERENVAYFSRQANPLRSEDICVGKPVCVPTTKRYNYERAIVKQIIEGENKALIQLVDWGDLMEVPFNKIKPIRDSFLISSAVAMFCAADVSQVWDNRLQKFLYPGFSFVIRIKSVGNSFMTPNIVNIFELPNRK